MPLSCSCDWEPEEGSIIFYPPDDFERWRSKRTQSCGSCDELISRGDIVARFKITRLPEGETEIEIYGEDGEMPRNPIYLCEKCGEIYFNLAEIGFTCVSPYDDMRKLLVEYQETYRPPKIK